MEQKRRTITYRKKSGAKKVWTVIGIILGLALIFYVSYRLSYGLFSSGENKDETTQSTQEDIANMPREELEKKYMELQEKLEEKDKEIEMLTDRLEDASKKDEKDKEEADLEKEDKKEDTGSEHQNAASEQPKQPQHTETNTQSNTGAPATSTPPPASDSQFQSNSELISPEDLAAMEQATR
ncbi:MAG: hypothetical protein IJT38_02380 [Clostridia bacterium]|nr:hypothetical protein [Clostridia bacterium]